jgi:hypothetical protein
MGGEEINVTPGIQLSSSPHVATRQLTVLADKGAGEDVGAVERERGREGDGGCRRVTVLWPLLEVVKDFDEELVWEHGVILSVAVGREKAKADKGEQEINNASWGEEGEERAKKNGERAKQGKRIRLIREKAQASFHRARDRNKWSDEEKKGV